MHPHGVLRDAVRVQKRLGLPEATPAFPEACSSHPRLPGAKARNSAAALCNGLMASFDRSSEIPQGAVAPHGRRSGPGGQAPGPGKRKPRADVRGASAVKAGQRDCMISRMSRAVSEGVLPTRTPTFSSASFLAWAVPAEPDTMAPAWPIVLPSGAVKPAT